MYAPFFGLSQEPFSIAPDPRFLYMSERHREALAHLLYGLSAGGGFVLLTGEIGAGKTTVCRGFLEQVPNSCTVAYIFNPKLTVAELLRTIRHEFGVTLPENGPDGRFTVKAQVDALNTFLLTGHAKGRQAVLVIDEAQSLSPDVLEQLRLLTNLETSERKLLQIILIGQPELRDLLAQPELEQLAQRVIARYHLDALSADETPLYVRHRMAVAGPNAALPFTAKALDALHRLTGGVPRRINLVADRALLGAYGQVQPVVSHQMVEQAAVEVFGHPARTKAAGAPGAAQPLGSGWSPATWPWPQRVTAGMAALALVLLLGVWWGQRMNPVAPKAPSAAEGLTGTVGGPGASPGAGAGVGVEAGSPLSTAARGPGAPVATAAGAAPVAFNSDVTELLRSATADLGTAWRSLALRWNVAVGRGDACQVVKQAGLACLVNATGGLPMMRQLARPMLLSLATPKGGTVYAELVALDDQRATLFAGGQYHDLKFVALAQIWRGEIQTLWRTPPGWREGRDALEDDATRQWISQRLGDAAATAGAAAGGGATAPPALRERLRLMQMAQGLPTEAAALPITLVHLNRGSGVAEPRLPAALER
jgi:general secretion pathway protein A